MSDTQKQDIIDILEILRDDRESKDTDPFRANTYENAIRYIERHPDTPLKDMEFSNAVKGVVSSYLKGQSMKEILKAKGVDVSIDFHSYRRIKSVPGIGPKWARWLVISKGITSIEGLRKNSNLLTAAQRLGLQYHEELTKRIPRDEIDLHKEKLREVINRSFTIAGSYRRGAQQSGDIDVLIRATKRETEQHRNFNQHAGNILRTIVERLGGYLLGNFMYGDVKYAGVCRLKSDTPARHIDFLITNYYQYPFALLYFTGNGAFNELMRGYARRKGYTLNQEGIQSLKGGGYIKGFTSEKEIFHFLDLPYIEPRRRNARVLQKYIKI